VVGELVRPFVELPIGQRDAVVQHSGRERPFGGGSLEELLKPSR
jgi:hypothetical protein